MLVVSSTTSDKEIGQNFLRPPGCGETALLLCCSSSPMPYIDSSSRLESEPFRPQQMACYSWDRTLVFSPLKVEALIMYLYGCISDQSGQVLI